MSSSIEALQQRLEQVEAERDAFEDMAKWMSADLSSIGDERDALAAHVDRLHCAAEACVQVHEEGFSPTPDELRELNDALDARFSQSLARRDARVKAEALRELAKHMESNGYTDEASGVRSYASSQQAEGGGDE
ncbi:hypothetical protein [Halomonas sp. MMSF_3323]|uniref:hypothetical protein n=1 Tax=Halomonas sp. MMSF_3323 TaxID=3046701 RepID=UPI00273FF9A3|nr:hypothetical protein [Halomonas sp. MMSF_3323]